MPEVLHAAVPGVVAWLKTDEGMYWSLHRVAQTVMGHEDDDGAFATVMDEDEFAGSAARWPVPYVVHDLDIDNDHDRAVAQAAEAFAELLGTKALMP